MTALFILLLGLLPALFSLWWLRRNPLVVPPSSSALSIAAERELLSSQRHLAHAHYVEGLGYMIGDLTCDFNARSPYLRCAVNPSGPCETCRWRRLRPGLEPSAPPRSI